MPVDRKFRIGACVAGALVATFPALVCIAALRTVVRLQSVASHPAWLGSMFHSVVAALAAAATVFAFVGTVGVAMLGRYLLRRRRRV